MLCPRIEGSKVMGLRMGLGLGLELGTIPREMAVDRNLGNSTHLKQFLPSNVYSRLVGKIEP